MNASQAARIAVAAALVAGAVAASAQVGNGFSTGNPVGSKVVDAKGNLRVPENYRDLYQAFGGRAMAIIGSPGAIEIHKVYASAGATDAHRESGVFA
jgi:hypothetical protein